LAQAHHGFHEIDLLFIESIKEILVCSPNPLWCDYFSDVATTEPWGTDSDASVPQVVVSGGYPTTYTDQSRRDRIPTHQVDFLGWNLRQIDKLT